MIRSILYEVKRSIVSDIKWKNAIKITGYNVLLKLESEYNFYFDNLYKQIALTYNEASPDYNYLQLTNFNSIIIKKLLSIDSNHNNNIYNIYNNFKQQKNISIDYSKIIPFMECLDSNLIAFKYDSLSNHKLHSIGYLNTKANSLVFICNNFWEFLNRLYKPKDNKKK